jgi:hypothetical protein
MFLLVTMTPQDLSVIDEAGRRCAGCHTGRHWRRFEVLRHEGREPIVACPSCRPRLAAMPPPPPPAPEPPKVSKAERPRSTKNAAQKNGAAKKPQHQPEDRLRRALRELPAGKHSTGRIAKAAGLNHAKVLARLHALEEAGEIQQVGKHWSTERPSTDLEAAFDRLQASTGNLRIVRDRDR